MKPPLLFLSPTAPTPRGNGLAMRAYAVLRALSRKHAVHLLTLNHPSADPDGRSALAALCEQAAFVPIGLWSRRNETIRGIVARWPGAYRLLIREPYEWRRVSRAGIVYPFALRNFDVVHVFRCYMIPVLDLLASEISWRLSQLDVDDIESRTRKGLAAMHRLNGEAAAMLRQEVEAEQYERIERERLRQFDRVFAASPADRDVIRTQGLHPSPEILPNVVEPETPKPVPRHAGLRLLFVGSLGYAPNTDAVRHFCRGILPEIWKLTTGPVTFDIVGGGLPAAAAADMARIPGVRVHGWVEDLDRFYDDASIVVVPLRAGGGTRIKILEAFARGLPVVSTREGMAGIEAVDGVHALLADTQQAFAEACLRLGTDDALCARVTAEAAKLVRERHTAEVLENVL